MRKHVLRVLTLALVAISVLACTPEQVRTWRANAGLPELTDAELVKQTEDVTAALEAQGVARDVQATWIVKPGDPILCNHGGLFMRLDADSFLCGSEPAPYVPVGVWDRLAQCESGGRWDLNVGAFDGGLQFHPATWRGFGGERYAKYAWQATREEQIDIAEMVKARQGWGAWPACSRKLGLR